MNKPFEFSRNALVLLLALSSTVLLPAQSANASTQAVSGATVSYERDWIISPKAAHELIRQGALLIDARGEDLKKKDAPIKNAVSLTWQDLTEPDLPTKGRLLEDNNVLNKKLQALGVNKNQPIVVVADTVNGWVEDGRIAWTLRTFGHTKVVAVDGGLAALLREGVPNVQPAKIPGDFTVTRNSKWEIRHEELKTLVGKQDVVILDVREPREYEGKTPYGESRGGHVPGAKHIWYKELLDSEGKILPRAEIEKKLTTLGIKKDSKVVAYCTGGIRSGWFTTVLQDSGYKKARNYTGSMWEWSSLPAKDYPLVKE